MSKHVVPQPIRDAVYARAGGQRCERCGDTFGGPWVIHHRKLLSRGGKDTLTNLVLLCDFGGCHDTQVHQKVARAEAEGWIVSSWADPADVPVVIDGTAFFLTPDGGYRSEGDVA